MTYKKHPRVRALQELSRPSEETIHTHIARFLAEKVTDDDVFWSSIETSNQQGGSRGIVKQGKLKARGVKAGVPDILVTYNPMGNYDFNAILWLEVKTPKGTLSLNQKAMHKELRTKGHIVNVVRSVEDVQESLRKHGIPFEEEE